MKLDDLARVINLHKELLEARKDLANFDEIPHLTSFVLNGEDDDEDLFEHTTYVRTDDSKELVAAARAAIRAILQTRIDGLEETLKGLGVEP